MKTKEQLIELANEKGLELIFHDEPEAGREMHYWYGGTLVTLTDKETDDTYELVANGDVWAKFYDKDGDESIFVKDKGNSALFYHEMMTEITDDDHLDQLVENWGNETFPALQIENNNWFELFSNYEDERPNFEEVLDADKFRYALEEAIKIIVEFKEA